jgi:hypothetical protein
MERASDGTHSLTSHTGPPNLNDDGDFSKWTRRSFLKRARKQPQRITFSTYDIEGAKAPARLSFEALERRVLLAGSVLASVSNGNLSIYGDVAANAIVLDQSGLNADQVRITAAGGTTINDQADPVIVSGITRGVGIELRGGDDTVTLNNLSLPGNVWINDDAGANTLTVDNVQLAKTLNVKNISSLGATITIANTTLGKHLRISTGAGGQDVELRSVEVKAKTRIGSGDGADVLTIDDSTFHQSVKLYAGKGADLIEIDSHGDPAGAPTVFNRRVSIQMKQGDDTLKLGVTGETGNRAIFASRTKFDGGKGQDSLLDYDASTYEREIRVKDFESNSATADTTAPVVSSTNPADSATDIARNRKITATFSEPMDPLTITTTTVTVTAPGAVPVLGTVDFVGTTMTFTPDDNLAANTLFTVTISTGAEDLAGNALASNFVLTFTTGATADTTAPTVTSTNPIDDQTNVLINKPVSGIFSESMDPLTLPGNFIVTGPGTTPVLGALNYDGASKTATFTPTSNLAINTLFTATIVAGNNGVKDLAGNTLASDKVWTFTTGTQIAQAPIELGRAGPFAVMATASTTGTANDITGDVGLSPGSAQGFPPSEVSGNIHVNDQTIIDAQADLLAAYNDAVSRSTTSVSLPGNMGGLTFTPGLYTNSTSVLISGAGASNNVTLDAQGDANAIFIFKMGSTLTTGPAAQVILAGGANPNNIFWQVGSSATLDTTTIFKGNILASVSITVNAGADVTGRLLGGSSTGGSVTVNASTVTVPT